MTPCPTCGRVAPAVVVGGRAVCASCRTPIGGPAARVVGFAHKATTVSGSVARAAGWLTLAGGLLAALLMGIFFRWLFPEGSIQYIAAGITALFTVPLALLLVRGGAFLKQRGAAGERAHALGIVRELAAREGGSVSAAAASRAIGKTEAETDALLTELAKAGKAELDVTDQGEVLYRFEKPLPGGRLRFDDGGLSAEQEALVEEDQAPRRDVRRA